MSSRVYPMLSWLYLATVLLSGCSSMTSVESGFATPDRALESADSAAAVRRSDWLKHLYQQYDDWRGTGYLYGGTTRNGVDCSGFVNVTYRDQLDSWVPRTTLLQSQFGEPVAMGELQAGDLVFFKTADKVRHVGIYLEKGKFLHASSSEGVIISRLDSAYWRGKFWQARRMAP
ncbi:NlpC/P60 family protein [Candidatus Thalassolituus haligoni]|uniref:NlpC/P60 family protein n=1 Tax=Candidatus Thalassolituus haligoni TaxID=3100113 RepID=UPI003515D9C0|tara:strand:- start:2038 stop:2559 length:522 start_codon:yes stop_codon:yes gene_type:complete